MTPIESVLTELGITYRVIDDEAFSPCPFHSPDNHPSWSVNLSSGLSYCFSCGARHNLASLVSSIRGTSYAESTIYVNQKVGHARTNRWREDYDNVSFSPMAMKVTAADMAFFTDPPQEALEDKHVNFESVEYYGIKWNPDRQSWIFPFYDPFSHELWGWQEKNARLFRNFPAGTRKSRTLFGINKKLRKSGVILVESPIDCAVMCDAGFENTVASMGVPSGSYQLELLSNFTDGIILALDNDKAGINATKSLLPAAMRLFKSVHIYCYFDGVITDAAKDPGEQSIDSIELSMNNLHSPLNWLRCSHVKN